jgi:3-phenylpropionate/trans-cinnamate dioxygenase ferredoxin reductase subunit
MEAAMQNIVVIGAGHAGVELAHSLRQRGFAGRITLVSDEADLPYHRPPLSKDFLKGDTTEPLLLRAEAAYERNTIELMRGRRATGIDRAAKIVRLDNGDALAYDHLALALGARNRGLPIPGADHANVLELRDLNQALRLLSLLPKLRRVAIIGGGFIGLEIAAVLRGKGIAVDIIEIAGRLMARAVSEPVSDYFRRFHSDAGARLHFRSQAASIAHESGKAVIRLTDGGELTADAAMLAAGIVPNTELAAEAGLRIDNGIVVGSLLLTGDPAISALGDCAAFPCIYSDGLTRLESVQNAVDQARTIAARLTGDSQPYSALPWFWSNQGAARLQIAGLGAGYDLPIIRGDVEAHKFSVFLYRGNQLLAVESVNSPADHMLARRLIASGIRVPHELAGRPDADLKTLIS